MFEKHSLNEGNPKEYHEKAEEWKSVAKTSGSDILEEGTAKEGIQVHLVGKINRDI